MALEPPQKKPRFAPERRSADVPFSLHAFYEAMDASDHQNYDEAEFDELRARGLKAVTALFASREQSVRDELLDAHHAYISRHAPDYQKFMDIQNEEKLREQRILDEIAEKKREQRREYHRKWKLQKKEREKAGVLGGVNVTDHQDDMEVDEHEKESVAPAEDVVNIDKKRDKEEKKERKERDRKERKERKERKRQEKKERKEKEKQERREKRRLKKEREKEKENEGEVVVKSENQSESDRERPPSAPPGHPFSIFDTVILTEKRHRKPTAPKVIEDPLRDRSKVKIKEKDKEKEKEKDKDKYIIKEESTKGKEDEPLDLSVGSPGGASDSSIIQTKDDLKAEAKPSRKRKRADSALATPSESAANVETPKAKDPMEEFDLTPKQCASQGCDELALPLTQFCFAHITSDPHQVLCIPCTYEIRLPYGEHRVCGYPLLKGSGTTLCANHADLTKVPENKRPVQPSSTQGAPAKDLIPSMAQHARPLSLPGSSMMGQFDARPAPLPPFPDRVAPKPVLPPPPMLSTQAQQVRPTVPPPPMRPLAPPMLPIQSASALSQPSSQFASMMNALKSQNAAKAAQLKQTMQLYAHNKLINAQTPPPPRSGASPTIAPTTLPNLAPAPAALARGVSTPSFPTFYNAPTTTLPAVDWKKVMMTANSTSKPIAPTTGAPPPSLLAAAGQPLRPAPLSVTATPTMSTDSAQALALQFQKAQYQQLQQQLQQLQQQQQPQQQPHVTPQQQQQHPQR